MILTTALVSLFSLVAIFALAWLGWRPRGRGTRATTTSSSYQEVMVRVQGGYEPDRIIVQHGRPVRLHFRREESAACSEWVVFRAFRKNARLPQGETVAVEFVPERPGVYPFGCQSGVQQGTLVVE